jgi:hypothetical protein
MNMSGLLYAPAALSPGKFPRYQLQMRVCDRQLCRILTVLKDDDNADDGNITSV